MQCQLCYEEVRRVRTVGSKYAGSKTIKKHMCPDCSADVTLLTVDGKLIVKCERCAPEGVACDVCLPPPPGAGHEKSDGNKSKG